VNLLLDIPRRQKMEGLEGPNCFLTCSSRCFLKGFAIAGTFARLITNTQPNKGSRKSGEKRLLSPFLGERNKQVCKVE